MKKLICITILFLIGCTAFGQQEPQFTQYMYNSGVINPAYVGSKGYTNWYGLYRSQWVGLEGAPQTAAISVNKPIEGSNLGYGITVINDRIGPSDETQFAIDLSYTLKLNGDSRLAFGIKGSGNLLNVDYSKLNQFNPGEGILQNNVANRFSPNIGVGFYYYTAKSYFGISVPMILDSKRYDDIVTSEVNQRYHLYVTGGKVFELNPTIKFKPAFITKVVNGAPLQVDLSGNFLVNNTFSFGLAYRWDAAVSAMAGFQVTKNWFIGYGYDRETTRLTGYNSGSHELFLQFDIFERGSRIETPRFF